MRLLPCACWYPELHLWQARADLEPALGIRNVEHIAGVVDTEVTASALTDRAYHVFNPLLSSVLCPHGFNGPCEAHGLRIPRAGVLIAALPRVAGITDIAVGPRTCLVSWQ